MLHKSHIITVWKYVMRRLALLLSLSLALAAPAAGQQPPQQLAPQPATQPEWRQATEHQVLLRLSEFEPGEIRLVAGQPARLVFYNQSATPLGFRAESFFEAAQVRSGDADLVANGGMVLAPGETRSVTLVPARGRYRMRSQNWFRRLIGMSAVIVVEPARG